VVVSSFPLIEGNLPPKPSAFRVEDVTLQHCESPSIGESFTQEILPWFGSLRSVARVLECRRFFGEGETRYREQENRLEAVRWQLVDDRAEVAARRSVERGCGSDQERVWSRAGFDGDKLGLLEASDAKGRGGADRGQISEVVECDSIRRGEGLVCRYGYVLRVTAGVGELVEKSWYGLNSMSVLGALALLDQRSPFVSNTSHPEVAIGIEGNTMRRSEDRAVDAEMRGRVGAPGGQLRGDELDYVCAVGHPEGFVEGGSGCRCGGLQHVGAASSASDTRDDHQRAGKDNCGQDCAPVYSPRPSLEFGQHGEVCRYGQIGHFREGRQGSCFLVVFNCWRLGSGPGVTGQGKRRLGAFVYFVVLLVAHGLVSFFRFRRAGLF
jgi:hypothetical protein